MWFLSLSTLCMSHSAPLPLFLPSFQRNVTWFPSSPLHFLHSLLDFLHSSHSHWDSYISTLIPLIPTSISTSIPRILLTPTLIPGIPIPFSILPSFQLPFPRTPFILFPDYPFRLLQIASFCYWHNPIYWFQKIEFIKWIVNASIVKQQYVSSKVLLCQESFFKKYVY